MSRPAATPHDKGQDSIAIFRVLGELLQLGYGNEYQLSL